MKFNLESEFQSIQLKPWPNPSQKIKWKLKKGDPIKITKYVRKRWVISDQNQYQSHSRKSINLRSKMGNVISRLLKK